MMDWMFTIDGWIGLATLTLLEIVLGIDNLVFLTIAASKLPPEQRAKAQKIGLMGALVLRILMLSMLVWLTKLVTPIVTIAGFTLHPEPPGRADSSRRQSQRSQRHQTQQTQQTHQMHQFHFFPCYS